MTIPATVFDLSPADKGCVAVQDILLADATLKEWHKLRVYRVDFISDEVMRKFPPPAIFVNLQAEEHEPKPGRCVTLRYTVAVTIVRAQPDVKLDPKDPALSSVVTVAKVALWTNPNLQVSRYSNVSLAETATFQALDYQGADEIDKTLMLSHSFLIDYSLSGLPVETLEPA